MDTIGKLALSPPEMQTRFRQLAGSNVAYPRHIDANVPIVPVLDTTRPVTERIVLSDDESAATSGSFQWIYVADSSLWQKINSVSEINFASVSVDMTFTGTSVYSMFALARYLNGTDTIDVNLGDLDSFNVGFDFPSSIELMKFPKVLPTIMPVYKRGDEPLEFSLIEIKSVFERVSGTGTMAPELTIQMDLMY